jgi:hypothetical protein
MQLLASYSNVTGVTLWGANGIAVFKVQFLGLLQKTARVGSYALCSRGTGLSFFSADRRVLHAAKFISEKQLEPNRKEISQKLAGTEYIHRLRAAPSSHEVNLLVISIRVVYA